MQHMQRRWPALLRLLRLLRPPNPNGQADSEAEFIRLLNADIYAEAKARREKEER
jgi:hypothetical protein